MAEATHAQTGSQRLAALLIGDASPSEVTLITHYPVARSAGQGGIPLQSNLIFHAILMVILVGQLLGLVLFAWR